MASGSKAKTGKKLSIVRQMMKAIQNAFNAVHHVVIIIIPSRKISIMIIRMDKVVFFHKMTIEY